MDPERAELRKLILLCALLEALALIPAVVVLVLRRH